MVETELMRFFFFLGLLVGCMIVFYGGLGVAAYAPDLSTVIDPLVIALLKDVVGPVSAGFGGAIAGAYSAYFLQQRNERERERKAEFSIVRKTTIQLNEKINELFSIRKHNIYPSRNSPVRFLNIPKIPSTPGVQDRVDTQMIDILVSVGSIAGLNCIFLADARYRACFENFSNRNTMLDDYRASLHQSKFGFQDGVGLHDIASVVGVGRLLAINDTTEKMIEVLDETIKSLREALALTSAALDEKFKGSGMKTIRLELTVGEEYLAPLPAPYFNRASLQDYLRKEHRAEV